MKPSRQPATSVVFGGTASRVPIIFSRELEVKRSKAEDAIPLIAGKASRFADSRQDNPW